jgi:hypothetical protein
LDQEGFVEEVRTTPTSLRSNFQEELSDILLRLHGGVMPRWASLVPGKTAAIPSFNPVGTEKRYPLMYKVSTMLSFPGSFVIKLTFA